MLQKLHEEAVNHFASGWAWRALDPRLTQDHLAPRRRHPDRSRRHGAALYADVWEHAYYIDYRNERPRFATTVLSYIVNWDFVAQNLDGQGFERANQQGVDTPELMA